MAEDRYYDGMTAKAHQPLVSIAGDQLVIASAEDGEIARWPIADMHVIDANKVTGGINFGRTGDPLPRLVLLDSAVRRTLLENHPHLREWKGRAARRGLAVGAAWTLAGLLIATGAYFGWRDGSAALVRFVPRSWEQKLGAHIYKALTGNLTVCTGADGRKAMQALVARLAPARLRADATIDVVELKLPNAVALPGDHVMVTTGLIDLATTPDMLAAVLAHELAHLELRHPTQSVIANLGISATVTIVLGESGAGNAAAMVTALSYSRRMEQEADLRGLDLLRAAGLRADGMAAFFKVMQEKAGAEGGSLLPDWLASHPGLDERAGYTSADSTGETAMSEAAWHSVKQVCGAGG